jgi:hypothetical protein
MAASGETSWPPVGTFLAVYGEILMAADRKRARRKAGTAPRADPATGTVRIARWGRRHRSGPPNHLSSCPLGVSRDEIESVG